MAIPTTLNSVSGSKQVSGQYTEAGGYEFVTDMKYDPEGSSQVIDLSRHTVQDKFGNQQMTNGQGMAFKSPADIGFFAGMNYFESVAGDRQSTQGGDNHIYTQGNETKQIGEADTKQVEAAKKLQEATHEIDKKKMDTIKNTKGSQVECPNCATEIATDGGMCLIDLACKLIRLGIPNFPYPLDIVERFLNWLGIPLLTPEPVKELNGGQGCGSPGCKNGMVESPQKAIQTANEQAANEIQSRQKELEQYQRDMGGGGSQVFGPFMGDVTIQAGHPETQNNAPVVELKNNRTLPFRLGHAKDKRKGLIPYTNGNCKEAIFSEPLINPGSLFVNVTEKFKLVAGSPGIDVMTTGKLDVMGALTNIGATKGELMLYSDNLTTLKGKNVLIDAKDRSGDTGVRIESDNTMIAGGLSVTGDLALKGSLVMDGGLHCTHITAPGERVSSGPTGDAHQVHSNATWNNPVKPQASVWDLYDKAYKKVGRNAYNAITLGILRPPEMKTLIEETYSSVMLKTVVDNHKMPTGFALPFNAPPGIPTGAPLMVKGIGITSKGDLVKLTYAFVIPKQIIPVFNFPHNHNSPGNDHSHDYTSIQSSLPGNTASAREASPEPSHVPTPAKTSGMGTKPGHKSIGDLCIPCINLGGGGNARRNAGYGLGASNPFADTNYVQADGQFDPNGNLIPQPSIDINCVG